MKENVIEIIGWYGTIAIVVAYALASLSFITSEALLYQILNITGAAGLVIHSFYKKDYQPAVLNIIWITIALVALVKVYLHL